MSNMLKLVAVGHASTIDSNKMENLISSGLGPAAHAVAPVHSAQEVMDRAQTAESDVTHTIAQPIEHVDFTVPASVKSAAHSWNTSIHLATKNLTHDFGDIPIPWQHGD